MPVLAPDDGGAEVEAALGPDLQLLDGAAAELAYLNGLLELVHDVRAAGLGREDGPAYLLRLRDAADVHGLLHLGLVQAPGGETNAHVVEHAEAAGNLLAAVVGDGIDGDLVAVEAAEAHGLGRVAVIDAEGGVELRHGAAVAVHVEELDALGGVLVGEDGHQHGHEGVEAAHLAGVEVLALLALGEEGLLEGAEGVDRVGAEYGHVGVEHGHGRAEAGHHGGVLVVANLVNLQQVELKRLARLDEVVEHSEALAERAASARAEQRGAVKYLADILFVKLSHVESSLFLIKYAVFPLYFCRPVVCKPALPQIHDRVGLAKLQG